MLFPVCSSNASGVGKTTKGRRLGNIALALSVLACLAAIATALGLYFSGTGEKLFHYFHNLVIGNTTAPAESKTRESKYEYSYDIPGGGNYAYQYDGNY